MKKCFTLFAIGALMLSSATTALASEGNVQEVNISSNEQYSIEFDDAALKGATKLSSETYEENGRLITVTKYLTVNGDIITDTFERSAVMALSKKWN